MRLHWTRLTLLITLALTALGACLPWLVEAPEHVLKWGSGTIYGLSTPHGKVCLAVSLFFGALLLLRKRDRPVSRAWAALALPAFFVAFCAVILVGGLSPQSVLEDARDEGLSELELTVLEAEVANLDRGAGTYLSVLGWPMAGLLGLASMFVRRA